MPSVQNSLHPVDEATESALRKYQQRDEKAHKSDDAVTILSYPSKEERAVRAQIATKTMKAMGLDVTSEYAKLEQLAKHRAGLLAEAAKVRYEDKKNYRDLLVLPADEPVPPPTPPPTDHRFWWARTDWTGSAYEWGQYEINAGMPGDAVIFSGWVTSHDGDLRLGSFGATATFEIQRNRVPPSTSNRWISAPTVDISGAVRGVVASFDFWSPDLRDNWSRCSMILKQRVFQAGFNGVRELAVDEKPILLFDQDDGGSVDYVLPGIHAMPPLEFSIPGVVESVWATLNVTFNFEVKGNGSYFHFNTPPLSLLFRQWQLVPM